MKGKSIAAVMAALGISGATDSIYPGRTYRDLRTKPNPDRLARAEERRKRRNARKAADRERRNG